MDDDSIACVKKLIHNAVDKASPYALSQHKETDIYEKIKHFSFSDLAITPQGRGMLWAWINGYVGSCGAKQVPATIASTCNTVESVFHAVKKVSDEA